MNPSEKYIEGTKVGKRWLMNKNTPKSPEGDLFLPSGGYYCEAE